MNSSSFNQNLNDKLKKNIISHNFNNKDPKNPFISKISLLKPKIKLNNFIKINVNYKDYPKPHTKYSTPNSKPPFHIKMDNRETFPKKPRQTKLNSYLSYKRVPHNNNNNNNNSNIPYQHYPTKSSLSGDTDNNNKYVYSYNKYLYSNDGKNFNSFIINYTNKTIYSKEEIIKSPNLKIIYEDCIRRKKDLEMRKEKLTEKIKSHSKELEEISKKNKDLEKKNQELENELSEYQYLLNEKIKNTNAIDITYSKEERLKKHITLNKKKIKKSN